LTRLTGTILESVAWSPDSSKLLFASNRDPGEDEDHATNGLTIRNIWTVNADGTGIRPLTRFRHVESDTPTWSPDGARIAYTSMRPVDGSQKETPTSGNIWVMKADGSDAFPLTTSTGLVGNGFPAWSPDGTMIAFISARYLDNPKSGNIRAIDNIWVIHADGSGSRAVTQFGKPSLLAPPLRWRP
jgi:Tol biopolymer transport system component